MYRPVPRPSSIPKLFGHAFANPTLLTRALTHRSLSYETGPEAVHNPESDNEQLEFLGDAVLGLLTAESLFRRFPSSREGELTRLRASLVSRRHLAEVAARLDLGQHLLLGRGEEQSGGRRKPALLANALEAFIAALFLDAGLPAAARFVEDHIVTPALPDLQRALIPGNTFSGAIGDHKSALQELLQAANLGQPRYVLAAESGPDHQKSFTIELQIEETPGHLRTLAQAEGATKKLAQQEAARLAFALLQQERQPA